MMMEVGEIELWHKVHLDFEIALTVADGKGMSRNSHRPTLRTDSRF